MIGVYTTDCGPFQDRSEEMLHFLLLVVMCENVNDGNDVDTAFVVCDHTSSKLLKVGLVIF